MRKTARIVVVSSTQIPHIIRRIVGQALGRPWGGYPQSSSPISAAASATSRTRCMSRCARGAPRRWAGAASRMDCATGGDLRLQPRPPCHPHSISSPGFGRTARWRPGRWSASPTREPTPPTAIPSAPRPWAPLPSIYPCDNMECDALDGVHQPSCSRGHAGLRHAAGHRLPMSANIDECAAAVGMEPLAYRMKNHDAQGLPRRLFRQHQLLSTPSGPVH